MKNAMSYSTRVMEDDIVFSQWSSDVFGFTPLSLRLSYEGLSYLGVPSLSSGFYQLYTRVFSTSSTSIRLDSGDFKEVSDPSIIEPSDFPNTSTLLVFKDGAPSYGSFNVPDWGTYDWGIPYTLGVDNPNYRTDPIVQCVKRPDELEDSYVDVRYLVAKDFFLYNSSSSDLILTPPDLFQPVECAGWMDVVSIAIDMNLSTIKSKPNMEVTLVLNTDGVLISSDGINFYRRYLETSILDDGTLDLHYGYFKYFTSTDVLVAEHTAFIDQMWSYDRRPEMEILVGHLTDEDKEAIADNTFTTEGKVKLYSALNSKYIKPTDLAKAIVKNIVPYVSTLPSDEYTIDSSITAGTDWNPTSLNFSNSHSYSPYFSMTPCAPINFKSKVDRPHKIKTKAIIVKDSSSLYFGSPPSLVPNLSPFDPLADSSTYLVHISSGVKCSIIFGGISVSLEAGDSISINIKDADRYQFHTRSYGPFQYRVSSSIRPYNESVGIYDNVPTSNRQVVPWFGGGGNVALVGYYGEFTPHEFVVEDRVFYAASAVYVFDVEVVIHPLDDTGEGEDIYQTGVVTTDNIVYTDNFNIYIDVCGQVVGKYTTGKYKTKKE